MSAASPAGGLRRSGSHGSNKIVRRETAAVTLRQSTLQLYVGMRPAHALRFQHCVAAVGEHWQGQPCRKSSSNSSINSINSNMWARLVSSPSTSAGIACSQAVNRHIAGMRDTGHKRHHSVQAVGRDDSQHPEQQQQLDLDTQQQKQQEATTGNEPQAAPVAGFVQVGGRGGRNARTLGQNHRLCVSVQFLLVAN